MAAFGGAACPSGCPDRFWARLARHLGLGRAPQDAAFPPLVINPIDFDEYFNRHKKGTLKATLAAQSGAAQSGDAQPSGPEPGSEPGSEAELAAPDAG